MNQHLFCTYHLSSSVYSEVVNDRALLNGPADALGGIIDKLMCQILDKWWMCSTNCKWKSSELLSQNDEIFAASQASNVKRTLAV